VKEPGEQEWGVISADFKDQGKEDIEAWRLGVVVPNALQEMVFEGFDVEVLPVFEKGVVFKMDAEGGRHCPGNEEYGDDQGYLSFVRREDVSRFSHCCRFGSGAK